MTGKMGAMTWRMTTRETDMEHNDTTHTVSISGIDHISTA
jgi:hypothetical protein